jgi:hypothetical protein
MEYMELLARYCGGKVPEEIAECWNESENSFPGTGNIHFLQDDFIEEYSTLANLDPETVVQIIKDAGKIQANTELERVIWHFYHVLYIEAKKPSSSAYAIDLEDVLPEIYGSFYLLLTLAGYPDCIEFYKAHNLPEDILYDSLRDVRLWVDLFKEQRGICGITNRILCWEQGILHGQTFQIGRLQFQKDFNFHEELYVFKSRKTGEVKALSGESVRYNAEGLVDGIGGVWDETGHWSSEYRHDGKTAFGNPISRDGYAHNELVVLDQSEWEQIFGKGGHAVNIHIPASGPMTLEACEASFKRAIEFFQKHFPEYTFNVFICESWLLDPQFGKLLKPSSNILKLQHSGYLFPFKGESECIFRVFGEKAEEEGFEAVPHTTGMQKAFADFLRNGGIFRNGAIFWLKKDFT